MTETEKYQLINQCETHSELREAILNIAEEGMIKGKKRDFDAQKMADRLLQIMAKERPLNNLTRSYGIRQQAVYLMFYAGILK